MKLWILTAKDALPQGDNPWEPWYDKAFGFVVRASTEEEARAFAHGSAGDENRGEFLRMTTAQTKTPWKDPKYSDCEELLPEGTAGVIIRDFAAA